MPGAVKEPTAATLKKYGLAPRQWSRLGASQDWMCPVCGRHLSVSRTAIDHEHIKGWKSLSPEKKRRQIRGILHGYPCNRFFVARNTLRTAESVAGYLRRHNNAPFF
jgi:hypothetical protein